MPSLSSCNRWEFKDVISVKHGGRGSPPGDLDRKAVMIWGSAGHAGVALRDPETAPWGAWAPGLGGESPAREWRAASHLPASGGLRAARRQRETSRRGSDGAIIGEHNL